MNDEELQSQIDKATKLLEEARIFHDTSSYDESERCTREAITMLEAHTERDDVGEERDTSSQKYALIGRLAHAYNRLNTISQRRADYQNAIHQAETAIGFCERIDDRERKCDLLGNIGLVHEHLSDYPKALEYYGKSLSVAEEIGYKSGATVIGNIGSVYLDLSDYPKALEYLGKALSIAEELGNKAGVANWLNNIGNVHWSLSDYPKALEYYGKALTIDEELGNKAGVAIHLGNIGTTYATVKFEGFDAVKAKEFLLKALAISTEISLKASLVRFHHSLSELYEHEQRLGDAFEHFKKHIAIKDEINIEETKKQESIREQQKAIEIERTRATAEKHILNNILPEEITQRLIKGEKPIADHFDCVSVLFMDIVDFTPLASSITAQQLVHLLNAIFSAADAVMREFGLEKIKTIGDAYMAVAGAPIMQEDHAYRAAQAALRLLEVMENLVVTFPDTYGDRSWIESIPEIKVRIGLHCGPVAAGVVGENKFLYDLWGDAVNTAARMESHGEAGKIHVSGDFVQTLSASVIPAKAGIHFSERGEMDIKGKGLMKTFFLERMYLDDLQRTQRTI